MKKLKNIRPKDGDYIFDGIKLITVKNGIPMVIAESGYYLDAKSLDIWDVNTHNFDKLYLRAYLDKLYSKLKSTSHSQNLVQQEDYLTIDTTNQE